MQSYRESTLAKLEAFFKNEWPYKVSYFGLLVMNNGRFIKNLRRGSGMEWGTSVRVLAFLDRYRRNPERTMELARADLYRTQKKKPAGPVRKGQSRSSRVAA